MPDSDDLELVVDNRRYSGWKAIRVTSSIESMVGSFALEVSDRWAGLDQAWPIQEEDPCRVEIGGEPVIDGFICTRSLSLSATARSLSYTGKDRAVALVECSFIVEGANVNAKSKKWTYRNIDIAQFAAAVADDFGIKVSVQPGLVLPKDPLLVAHPGETGFDAIKRAAGSAGVMVVSDGLGGIIITRSGTAHATALVQGENVLSASIEYDASDRFRRYLISSQIPGTDEASGEATRVQAEATDLGVRRTDRVLIIRPDKGYNAADAKRRADWEARTRAARAETVSISVQGWRQPDGRLWPLNQLSFVSVPAIGINGDMLISQREFSISEGGRVTQLHLIRPDALLPEVQATVKSGDGPGLWLVKGKDGELAEPGKR